MADGKYNTGKSNYFDECETDKTLFNNELLPFLKKLDIGENDIKTIVKMVDKIYSEGYSYGYKDCKHRLNGDVWVFFKL